jgi:ACS family glucarate transporter-like MFS transporter
LKPLLSSVPVRMRILAVLVALSFVNYLLRNNMSVAIESIQEEFHFSAQDVGWILGGFNFSYAVFQIPGGLFGEWLGPRRSLTIITAAWGLLTLLTGCVPHIMAASGGGALVALVAVRFLLGVSNAPMYPILAATVANWFPVGNWAFPNAVSSSALALGQAAIGPVVTTLVLHFGWRASFFWLAPTGLLAAAWWWWYARDTPRDHAAVQPAELKLIEADRASAPAQAESAKAWRRVLVQRDVLLLAASYFCMNYVFYMFAQWLFLYLVKERGFTVLESGWLYALPFIAGAVLATVGGLTCDWTCKRYGPRWGCRLPGAVGMLMVAIFLLAGVSAPNPYVAVGLLSLCFGFTQFTEGSFWQAATFLAGPHTAAATGVMNTGGNLPGFLAPLIGYMLDRFGWVPTLASGSLFALMSVVLWLMIRADVPATALEHAPKTT